ncbi:MAG TPA: CaiB/BaiF CoA-transferase family protein [Thermoanaerobaculia bacterium]|nr:CaiB/BaiF CoA-transferase family protein [Thermoanaerobaculia bacterium]
MAAPLAGLLVVDLSRLLPGPLAARLLADLGARVIKVEEPSLGDPIRISPPARKGVGALAAILLSGVESVALDLKQSAGREVLGRLLARADVLLESFRPGTLARLGFPPDELKARYPKLVICSLSGWGQEGPYAKRAGHDLTYQAVAGALASTSAMPAVQVADQIGAWSAVTSILAALLQRQSTGEGRHIDASLLDAALHANLIGWAVEAGGSKGVGEKLPLTGALPCYNLYETADGHHLALAALESHFWERFCRAARREDLIAKQYDTAPEIHRQMTELIRSRTLADWMELALREDVPVEPVLSAAEARVHPQVAARALLDNGPEGLPRLAFPSRLDGERPRAGDRIPKLGEQTKALLAELGIPREVAKAGGVGRRFSLKRWLARLR